MISFETVLLAIGLSLDSFAVSVFGGSSSNAGTRRGALKTALLVSLCFGLFQAIMPVLGWLAGSFAREFVTGVDHWIAFALLFAVGLKAILSSNASNVQKVGASLNLHSILALSIATSIDAFAVGISLAFTSLPLLETVALIGAITFALSFAGFLAGKKLHKIFGNNVIVLGGLILIGIGLKILLEHLGIAY